MWHQLDEVIKLNPERVLEIGPGLGLFKAMAKSMGIHVETMDLDPDLKPDHIANADSMPFEKDSFDVVCAFQMLEHVPYEKSLEIFSEMARVARKTIILSLPDSATRWSMAFHIPRFGIRWVSMPKPQLRVKKHQFDGQHYWEINKRGFALEKVIRDLSNAAPVQLINTFRVKEYSYHRFFLYEIVSDFNIRSRIK